MDRVVIVGLSDEISYVCLRSWGINLGGFFGGGRCGVDLERRGRMDLEEEKKWREGMRLGFCCLEGSFEWGRISFICLYIGLEKFWKVEFGKSWICGL